MDSRRFAVLFDDNKYSPQQDVVVYDTRLLPPFLADPSVGLFPVESVLYAIEIKSELNTPELKKAHKNASVLKSLTYQTGHYDEGGNPKEGVTHRLATAVFAFRTNLTGKTTTELERYKKLEPEGEPAIMQLCVVGSGTWYWYRQQWNEVLPVHPYYEVLAWLTGVVVNSQIIADTRGFPRVGRYWLA
jgi:hypothetical protein